MDRTTRPSPNAAFAERRAGRRRVLVECPDPCLVWAMTDVLVATGFDVVACAGASDHEPCPMTIGHRCPLAESADVILQVLTMADHARFPMIELLRALPAGPHCVQLARDAQWTAAGCGAVA